MMNQLACDTFSIHSRMKIVACVVAFELLPLLSCVALFIIITQRNFQTNAGLSRFASFFILFE